jgi:hypothetical protein
MSGEDVTIGATIGVLYALTTVRLKAPVRGPWKVTIIAYDDDPDETSVTLVLELRIDPSSRALGYELMPATPATPHEEKREVTGSDIGLAWGPFGGGSAVEAG